MRVEGDCSDPDVLIILKALFSRNPNLHKTYKQVSDKDDINTMLMEQRRAHDACKYVETTFVGGDENAVTMLRDARQLSTWDDKSGKRMQVYAALNSDGRRTSRAYLMMALNYTAALQLLLEAKSIAYDKDYLLFLCQQMLLFSKKDGNNRSLVALKLGMKEYFFQYLLRVLVPTMLEAKLAEDEGRAVGILDKIKDWVPLSHESINLATVDKLEDGRTRDPFYIIRIDKPVCELTREQEEELESYQSSYWFEGLSQEEKLVFKDCLKELLAGRAIPSQLRSRLPLLKNAYSHYTFRITISDRRLKIKEIMNFNHCGGLPYFDKKLYPNEEVMQKIALQNMQQQVAYAQHRSRLHGDRPWQNYAITLCSEYGDEMRAEYEDWKQWFGSRNGLLPQIIRIPLLLSYLLGLYLPKLLVVSVLKLIITVLPFGQTIWQNLASTGKALSLALTKKLAPLKEFLFGTYAPYIGFDSHIVGKTRQAAKESKHCFSSNICLNEFSLFESHDLTGVMGVYRQGEALLMRLQAQNESRLMGSLAQSLALLREEIGAVSFLLAFNQTTAKRGLRHQFAHYFLRLAEPVFRFIVSIFDTRVRAMQIMGATGLLVQEIKTVGKKLSAAGTPEMQLWPGCASGENRTGLVEYHLQCVAVAKEAPTTCLQEIRKRLAESGHIQAMTGFQASIAGTGGVRHKSMNSLPVEYQDEQLETPWADMKAVRQELQQRRMQPTLGVDPGFFERAFGKNPAKKILNLPGEVAEAEVEEPVPAAPEASSYNETQAAYSPCLWAQGVSTEEDRLFAAISQDRMFSSP